MFSSKVLRTVLAFVSLTCFAAGARAQATWYVDDDASSGGDGTSWATAHDSLSTALTAAQSGDQIWVAEGTYVGNFTLAPGVKVYGGFAGIETELEERDWSANPTILDGNQTGSVVTSPTAVTKPTRLDGFTITNGSGTLWGADTFGGGLFVESSSPTIVNDTFTGNSADRGGGLYLYKSSSTIANNTITGNSAERWGGGLYLYDSSSTIANNTITGNNADDGGGLYLWASSPTIADNMITGNSAHRGGGLYLGWHSRPSIANNAITGNSTSMGGGLYLADCSPTIANNAITGNSAERWGGGLYLYVSSPSIANNTITSNSAGYSGGGLVISNSSPTIANNTITGNSASDGGGLDLWSSYPTIANTIVAFNSSGIFRGSGTPTLRHNCVYGNAEYDYDGLSDPTGIDGNISAEPLLAGSQYGNVHIQPGSPCVDAGNNADTFGDWDMDGEPRIQPLGGTVDIGADESDSTVWPAGPYIIVRVSPVGNDANDGSSWALAKRTVQAGIDAASFLGGDVWVQAGTYYERVTLPPYAYLYGGFAAGETIRDQRDWDANVTTLDAQQQGSVVTARGGYRASAVDGFTITNGSGTVIGSDTRGGGLYLFHSSPTIANNTIAGNSSDDYGGGLYLRYSSPTIANNTITGNSARDGGGLDLVASSPTIANNTITGNIASSSGGGLYLLSSSPTIANNTIIGNDATGGGGLSLDHSSPTIANNTITGNSAAYEGGGLYLWDSSPTTTNNTITGNIAEFGGGLYLCDSSPTIANNTITGNSASYNGGGLYLHDSSPTIANTIVAFNSSGIYRYVTGGTPTLRYNCVYGNTEYDYAGLTDPTGTDGNISADPRLADTRYGNVHIQPDSPCVDAGSNVDASGDFDMDGEPRIQGGTVDIGADESDGTVWPAGPYVIVRVSPAGDDANDGSSWALAKGTVQAGIDVASALGGEVWVQAGTYYEPVSLYPFAYVYGGFAGGETARDQRDLDANVTTLDGQQQGSVVTAQAGYGAVGAIDGFTITNGSGTVSGVDTSGGGLYLRYCSPTIAHNKITGNSATIGGGLYLDHSSPTIANNTIAVNSASWGGGLHLRNSSPTIANNTIMGNDASYGGGLFLEYSSPIVGNNTIAVNNAFVGGGLSLESSSPIVGNNTITGNSAAVGGAMYINLGSPTIANTIVAFNSSGIHQDLVGTPTLQYNCVYGNTAYDYSGLIDPTGTDGNISADPVFVQIPDPGPDGLWETDDDLGDLQLSSGSPCIDAGDNDGVPPDTPDLDGDSDTEEPLPLDLVGSPRFLDNPTSPDTGNPGVAGPPIVDMGAYENAVWCGNGVVDPGEECDDGNIQPGDGCDATCHIEPEVIPTVSQWGLTVMALLLLSGLKVKFGQRRSAHA